MFRKILFLVISIVLIFSISSCQNSSDQHTEDKSETNKTLLEGDWHRTDAGYRILISKVNDDGNLTAQYFNPNPIKVECANWEESYNNLKVTIELRDFNYPGSTYRLSYLPDNDIFAGEYFQAVEGITFYFEFSRNK